MKRVSFEVAKAIKEAGYPQDECGYTEEGYQINPFIRSNEKTAYSAPTYLDVWLWLWREKKIFLAQCYKSVGKIEIDILDDIVYLGTLDTHSDPEEAIIAAIEYLVEHKLLK